MMNDLIWSDYTDAEHEKLSSNVQKLLKENFIVRNKDEASKKVYLDVTESLVEYETILNWIGLSLVVDSKLGVVGYKNAMEDSKLKMVFSPYEAKILMSLASLYYERISEVTLYRNVIVSHTELAEDLEKKGIEVVSKSKFTDAMKRFGSFNLIEVVENPDDGIRHYKLFNSLQLIMNQEYLSELLEILRQNNAGLSNEEVT